MSVNRRISSAAAAVLLIAYAAFSAFHLSPWAATWDEVDFVLALDRFDLLAMQPHAPGYPYFVLGGRLVRYFVEDPVQALGWWNLLLACSSAWPIYRIARRWLTSGLSWLAVALVLTLPMNWTLAVRPMSEGAALALLWWFLWSLVRLAENRTTGRYLAAGFLFGLLMGTRLSYLPFGVGLFLVWASVWRDSNLSPAGKAGKAAAWAVSAAVFQLAWVLAVAAAEGGLAGTIRLFAGFGAGHFTKWGGGVSPSGPSLWERVWRFVSDNWLWTGMFGRFLPVAVAAALLFAFLVWRLWKNRSSSNFSLKRLYAFARSPAGILTWCAIAYALWALLGQNIAKPRHAAPLASVSIFALAVATLRAGAWRRTAAALALLLAVVQTTHGARLVSLQHDERPAAYQLADDLASEPSSSTIVYTWEEERVLRYLRVPVQTRPIFTYEWFAANAAADSGARILLTGSVWEEFRRQAGLPESKVRKLVEFRSDPRLDPVYGTIALYEWNR